MKTKWLCILMILCLLISNTGWAAANSVLVGYLYLGNLHSPKDLSEIELKALTHVNVAFASIDDAYLPFLDENAREKLGWLQAEIKRQGASCRVLLSVGGWGCSGFCYAAQDEEHRMAFAEECLKLVEELGLDGVDLDWEYPVNGAWGQIDTLGEADRENYTLLLSALREVLGEEKMITIAFAPQSMELLEAQKVGKICDLIHLMAYDYSLENPAGLDESAKWIEGWMEAVPSHKLTLGVPFYGRSERKEYNGISYRDIRQLQQLQGVQVQEEAGADRLCLMEGSILFDSPRILKEKAEWAREMGLGGIMIWEIGQDAESELIQALFSEMR